jgi:hypothetical protein
MPLKASGAMKQHDNVEESKKAIFMIRRRYAAAVCLDSYAAIQYFDIRAE